MPDWFLDATAWILPVILAVTLHEAAHGWMAERFSDITARVLGRVSFNPLKHIDRIGTVALPGMLLLMHSPFLFGYAKPVPVNFGQLRPRRFGMFMVALAGPATNIIEALVGGALLHAGRGWITMDKTPWIFLNLYRLIVINCVLAVFNMIPILPLDGGRVVDSFLFGPIKWLYGRFERFGIILVMLGLLIPPMLGYDVGQKVIAPPVTWLMQQVLSATGNTDIPVVGFR